MSDIIEYSKYIIGIYSGHPEGITPLKLQKLLYYLKVWGIVSDNPVIKEPFYKWAYGPVNKSVYEEYKSFKGGPISIQFSKPVTVAKQAFTDFVVESYVDFPAVTLSAMTHKELPWQKTADNKPISEKLIKDYYSKFPFAKNFPLKPDNPYYPVLSDMYYAFILDMNPHEVKTPVYKSFQAYKQLTAKAKADFEDIIGSFLKQNTSGQ